MTHLLQGHTIERVAKDLSVSEWKVAQVRKHIRNPTQTPGTTDALKAVIRLEISQESALSDLATQIKDYTDNYNDAMNRGDEKAAFGWSQNRIKCVDMMARITGLYERPTENGPKDISVKVEFV